jgi:hypothetical protein
VLAQRVFYDMFQTKPRETTLHYFLLTRFGRVGRQRGAGFSAAATEGREQTLLNQLLVGNGWFCQTHRRWYLYIP